MIATLVRPGINRPWNVRNTTSAAKVGASPHSRVGIITRKLTLTITGLRPTRSEIGPYTSEPKATASTSIETVNPAVGALMEKALLSSGKIAWVVYMLAKMKAGTKKSVINAHIVDWFRSVVC